MSIASFLSEASSFQLIIYPLLFIMAMPFLVGIVVVVFKLDKGFEKHMQLYKGEE
jgi:hypothetical protein